jgi:hypothetical protein
MTTLAPSFLTWQSLPAFTWMRTPVWVFDYDNLRTVWANPAGLLLWQAGTVAELRSRDCSDISPSARNLLAGFLEALRRGESSPPVPWTIYPNGIPTSITITPTGIWLETGASAFCEASLAGAGLSGTLRRDLDALNHASAQISITAGWGDADAQSGRHRGVRTIDEATDDLPGRRCRAGDLRRAGWRPGDRAAHVSTQEGRAGTTVSAQRLRDPVGGWT